LDNAAVRPPEPEEEVLMTTKPILEFATPLPDGGAASSRSPEEIEKTYEATRAGLQETANAGLIIDTGYRQWSPISKQLKIVWSSSENWP
jgi:hypothetical protein